jgi:hypothetical protein
VPREVPQESPGRAQPVRAAIQREIHPRVVVPLIGSSGKVRRVREHPVEPSETVGEVGPHEFHGESLGSGRPSQSCERARVAVGGDHGPAGARRRPAQRTVPGPDLEQSPRASFLGEREEEERVLADGIDGAFVRIVRRSVWT